MSQNNNNEVPMQHGRFALSLLNTMIGEYLEKENNPLAVDMGFFHNAKKVSFDTPLPNQFDTPLSNKVVVFVHGLSNLENVWDYPPDDGTASSILGHYIDVYLDNAAPLIEQNYGTKLNHEHGFTPLFLRYNTGLPLDKNGRNLSKQLNRLISSYPVNIDELVLVGYGMGGQLIAHAQHTADESQAKWLPKLKRCFYLGNLNEGSMMSIILRLGSLLVRQIPIFYNHTLADWLDRRSRQIQINAVNPDQSIPTRKTMPTSFLEEKRHYFIDGDLKRDEEQRVNVPQNAPTHSQNAFVEGISPMRLAHSDRVYSLMSNWVSDQTVQTVALQEPSIEMEFNIDPSQTENDSLAQMLRGNENTENKDKERIFLAGTIDLMASAYDKTLEAIEEMHYSIVEEPFYALDKFPVVSQMAKPIELAQHEVLDAFYRTLRSRGKTMHKLAADMA